MDDEYREQSADSRSKSIAGLMFGRRTNGLLVELLEPVLWELGMSAMHDELPVPEGSVSLQHSK
jgi:hypothetical protein